MLTYEQAQAMVNEFFGNGVLFNDSFVTNFQVQRCGADGVFMWVETKNYNGYQYVSQSDFVNVTDTAGIALKY